jgi:hypothetical protein
MRKTLSIIAITLGLLAAGAPSVAQAADGGSPSPTIHLTPADIPHCYTVGLEFGSDDPPCTAAVTCTEGDATCTWFCDNELVSVECAYITDPGVLTWANILYGEIDHYRTQAHHETRVAHHRAARIRRQAHRIARLRATVRHLRHQHMG